MGWDSPSTVQTNWLVRTYWYQIFGDQYTDSVNLPPDYVNPPPDSVNLPPDSVTLPQSDKSGNLLYEAD